MPKTLYMKDLSPPARAVNMTIHLLGLEVEIKELNPVLRDQDQPKFRKMNPMRTIPIYDEGDFSLADSHAIMIYLLETYGKPEHSYLYPMDKRKRATIHQRLFFDCGILFPRLRAIMAPTYAGRLTELTKYMKINIDDAYAMLEEYLSQNLFLADDHLTIADLSAYTTTQSLNIVHPADGTRFPKVKKWLKTMSELDIVKKVNEPGGENHGNSLLLIMEVNKQNKKSKL
ncbi:glutathione S-transferase 1-like [Pectinophora gossypiella]|uniref:glutathione S-transferase 1-like n=1 Tax=Pectinophora gossypiella TaxID=13191 RepID=UPI00214E343A|nr:glutathione S-transferase 1-like [Pectinophora gossypiella]XP_049871533.1 glutathione S-transferase 1-like [Pectinophora gossypiella]